MQDNNRVETAPQPAEKPSQISTAVQTEEYSLFQTMQHNISQLETRLSQLEGQHCCCPGREDAARVSTSTSSSSSITEQVVFIAEDTDAPTAHGLEDTHSITDSNPDVAQDNPQEVIAVNTDIPVANRFTPLAEPCEPGEPGKQVKYIDLSANTRHQQTNPHSHHIKG